MIQVHLADLRAVYLPLLHTFAAKYTTKPRDGRLLVGVAGAAGSGKSTICALLVALANVLADADEDEKQVNEDDVDVVAATFPRAAVISMDGCVSSHRLFHETRDCGCSHDDHDDGVD